MAVGKAAFYVTSYAEAQAKKADIANKLEIISSIERIL